MSSEESHAVEQSTRPSRLVIVDDEPSILSLLTSIFKDCDFDVRGFSNGTSALEAMEQQGVDVLLTDKNLPDISGLELLEHARRIEPDAEVILITGYASLDTALRAIELGAFDYILKPPKNIFDVRRKVIQAMERVAVIRENRWLLADLRSKNMELAGAVEQMKSLQREIIQSEKLAGIGTLAAGMAHEVSSPLFGIMGLAEAIVDEEDVAVAKGYATEIVGYSKSIKEIVQQLSGYARAPNADFYGVVELGASLMDAARLVCRTNQLGAGAITLNVENDLRVSANPNELQQVFVNLLKNAVEAVVAAHGQAIDGGVTVNAARVNNIVEIRVLDKGNGIAPEQQKLVFDPFFTTKEPGQGTGLGLNVVYRIVTKYKGRIWLDDSSESGTTFTLQFNEEAG